MTQVLDPVEAPVRRVPWAPEGEAATEPLLTHEWLVTNALGGFASGTIGGVPTRRYHGLLVAALPAPLGRIVMLTDLIEEIRNGDETRMLLGAKNVESGNDPLPGAGN